MKISYFKIENIPAILWGVTADKIYLFVHGKGGSKDEAVHFAEIICAKGWQVLSIDLPGHGERHHEENFFDPWHIVPELQRLMIYLRQRYNKISLWASSIGAWFSMLAYGNEIFEKCLFVSPILNMERLICNMMQWASVSEKLLQQKKEINTDFGETLSWKYLTYVRNHQILKWTSPTAILYAGRDNLTERRVVDAFCESFHVDLSVMENGEHWFHTSEQLTVLDQWMKSHV